MGITTSTLILVRHGQSEWNATNQFTGWYDCDLTSQGVEEASNGAQLIKEAGLLPDAIYTSLQKRAIRTADIILEELDCEEIPIQRSWHLNERHYGDLTGKDKAAVRKEFGDDQLHAWRRGYNTPPPPISENNPFNPNNDPQYEGLSDIPLTECLADVVERLLPYWKKDILSSLEGGKTVLIVAHGNSLRALCKYLDAISEDEIADLNIPTGAPLVYHLNEDGFPSQSMPVLERSLDEEVARAAAEAVARQTH
ncbi:MAG TPA: 2,3-diphosphoglycerate-dependent phosphoglycerate mutase [Acidimicrobiales bacterium]|nr:2,3-diphosphoglycerate-dependent phosphoglycerate mutase [Acidimicrobiales bacterium]|tara:strand:- start:728 stop:1486 length:759 start_codon:yes stop_codon:yes gene_type:complete